MRTLSARKQSRLLVLVNRIASTVPAPAGMASRFNALFGQFTIARGVSFGLMAALIFLYYTFLITDGTFDLFRTSHSPQPLGLVFNNMLSHMLHGDFTVDANVVDFEGYVRDGKTYAYFGAALALLRIPLLLIGKMATDMTMLSIVMAACVSAYFTWASLTLLNNTARKGPLQGMVYAAFALSILIGGPQIQFLKASIYQEVISWAMALNAAFIYCAIRGLFLEAKFSAALLVSMATVAGLGLLTRVSTGIGLYLAMGLLLLSLAARARSGIGPHSAANDAFYLKSRIFLKWLFSPRALVPATILMGFATLCGIVNYERFGSPLTFANMQLHVSFGEERFAVLAQSGNFNILRLWYAILYYFFPINFVIGSDGKFLFEDMIRKFHDFSELPPSSFLISDPLLIVLSAYFLWNWRSKVAATLIERQHVAALLTAFTAPIFLMLTYYYAAFRFRGEFYAFLDLAALLGFYVFSRQEHGSPAQAGKRFATLLVWSAAIGIIASHLLLAAYKLSPLGTEDQFLPQGLIKGYYWKFDRWRNDTDGIW